MQARAYGDIAALPTGGYVFGFHRGGTANTPFEPIGFGDIAFNATALLRSDGTGTVGATAFSAAVLGDTISAMLSADLLPSRGAAPQDFAWALLAVDLAVTGLPRNADFVSSNNLNVTAVPEPASVALMLAGLMGVGAAARSRRRG